VLAVLLPLGVLAVLLLVYFFAPLRVDFLLLGIDRVPEGTALGRSDTMILMSVEPLTGRLKMVSIPRDLWVSIPGVGENRINTAHFFAESSAPGSGPAAAAQTVEQNFGVQVPYYVRLRFDAVLRIVDAMGGVTVNLPEDMAGLPAGQHHLTGEQALAFVRDRKGTDDFFRMEHAQFMLKSISLQLLSPLSWSHLPAVMQAGFSSVDTNLPFWHWPRVGLAFLRAVATGGIDARTITREMATPYTTEGGASVLMPNWALIQPYVSEMFAH
jgi:LCP family protein required for cell wall assembly